MEWLSVRCKKCGNGGDFYAPTNAAARKKARKYGWSVGVHTATCQECRGIEYEPLDWPDTYEVRP